MPEVISPPLGLADEEGLVDGEAEDEGETDGEAEALGETLGEADELGLRLGETLGLPTEDTERISTMPPTFGEAEFSVNEPLLIVVTASNTWSAHDTP